MDATMDNLFKLLWQVEHWTTAIFDKGMSMVSKYNIESFFLQLIGARIIKARLMNVTTLKWVFCHEHINRYRHSLLHQRITLVGCSFASFASQSKVKV